MKNALFLCILYLNFRISYCYNRKSFRSRPGTTEESESPWDVHAQWRNPPRRVPLPGGSGHSGGPPWNIHAPQRSLPGARFIYGKYYVVRGRSNQIMPYCFIHVFIKNNLKMSTKIKNKLSAVIRAH